MLITSRDLLRIEYLIGYDCIVGVICENYGCSLRVKTFDEISGEEIFFQRTFSTKNLMVDKAIILEHYAAEAKHNLKNYMSNLQKQKIEELI